MTHIGKLGNTSASGKFVARGEIRFGPVVFQNGWQIWEGAKYNDGWTERWNSNNTRGLDSLL
jgi:hypothetical protein